MGHKEPETGLNTLPQPEVRRARLAALSLLLLLILFHLLNNWLWRATNEVVFGFDRMFHQVTSLAYHNILSEGVNLRSLFAALTWSDYYAPLVHLVAAFSYKLFGVSMDVAAMSNSLFVALLIVSVYGIGERFGPVPLGRGVGDGGERRQLAGPWVGLLSAFVVSMLPIVFSMSRYLYVDFALTAMVALNVCLLMRTERFQHKGYSLLYGLSFGLGMLTKWTFFAFAAAPLLAALASPTVVGAAWQALRPSTWDGRKWLLAGLLGLGLTALWFVPNMDATGALPLGYALVPLSWLLWTATFYFALAPPVADEGAPSRRGANLVSALGLGVGVASSWYLTKINFFETFWLNAYGKPTGRSWGFDLYLDFLFREQLSPVFAVLVVVALIGLAWQHWQRARALAPERAWQQVFALGLDGWMLVLWVVVPFVIFSSGVSIIHSRYIMPLLPPLGIALVVWLSRLRPVWLRAALVGLVVVLALVQFAALSFDAWSPVRSAVPVLADGLSIQLPSSDRTDSGYWVAPEIMETIQELGDSQPLRLGVLVNKPQANSKHFIYLAYSDFPGVQVQELTPVGQGHQVYPRLFESDFVLLIEPAPRYPRRPETTATIERILNRPDDTFHRAFKLAQGYPLPDGTRLLLYQRRYPLQPDLDEAYYQALMADLKAQAGPGDGVIVTPPQEVYALGRNDAGALPPYPLPQEPVPLSSADTALLAELGQQHDRLWLVLGEPGQGDDRGAMALWLAEHFYRAGDAWYGPLQLLLYAPGTGEGAPSDFRPVDTVWRNGMALEGFRFLDRSLPLGGIMRLELLWRAEESISEQYKVSVQLLSSEGRLASQRDSEPVEGTRPTTAWTPGELIVDRYGLLLPPDLPPGDYQVVLGLYHAGTGERVAACCPESDAVPLVSVRVEDGTATIRR